MGDDDVWVALQRHWAASDANDFATEHQIYRADAVLEYPQSGDRIRGRANIEASRFAQPSTKRFTVRRMIGGGDLWISELVLMYDGQPFYVVSIMEFEGGEVVLMPNTSRQPGALCFLPVSGGETAALVHRLRPIPTATLFKWVHESLVTLAAGAANLVSSSVAAPSSLGLSSTIIRVDGLTWVRLLPPSRSSRRPSSEPLDDCGVGHPAALTHRLEPIAAAALLQRVDQRRHDPCTAGAQRVTDRDRAAVDVGLRRVGACVVGPCERRLDGAEVPACARLAQQPSRPGRPEGDGQVRARREVDTRPELNRSAEADRCAEEATSFITSKSAGGGAVSTPFPLRAESEGVEVAPGVTLRYWEAGAGRVLVMLPGLGHAASLYKYQLEGLCDKFRVIALDPRGHGESDKPERGYNYHTLAKDLDGFLRGLDLDDVTILGHSGGCKIILTYLELYGDSRLRAIVFSDDSPCHLRDGIFSADQALAAIDAFQGPDAITFSKGFSDQFLTDGADESAKEAFYREGLKLPRPYLAKLFRWAAFGDWWDAFALVKVPTLVIGGRVSKVPVKIAQGIHEAVPGSSLVVFEADEGGGHAMFWEGPRKYNDSLRTFMSSS